MLTHLKISGFKCLKSVDVPLKPLTVLIGPNDTGKSAFLEAILRLGEKMLPPPFGANDDPEDHWLLNKNTPFEIIAESVHGPIISRSDDGEKRRIVLDPETHAAKEALRNTIRLFRLPSAGVAMECQGYTEKEHEFELREDGARTAALIDHLLRRDRRRFSQLLIAMQTLVPGLHDIQIATPAAELRRVDIVVENGICLPAERFSSGVRLLLFFVALAYHPSPPSVILLEEPENGIHPKRLGEILAILREITEGKHGREAQIILTTHSPYLLDLIDLDRDQVLVFSRESDGSRTARPVDAQRMKTFLDEFMLGEVWFNQSEAGLVAKPS